jgi:uncharacterized protein YukE
MADSSNEIKVSTSTYEGYITKLTDYKRELDGYLGQLKTAADDLAEAYQSTGGSNISGRLADTMEDRYDELNGAISSIQLRIDQANNLLEELDEAESGSIGELVGQALGSVVSILKAFAGSK